MLMLGLNETMAQLAMTSSDHWYGHVLRREDGHVSRRTLDFDIDGQRRKGWPKRTWKKPFEDESVKIGLTMGYWPCRSYWIVGIYHFATWLR